MSDLGRNQHLWEGILEQRAHKNVPLDKAKLTSEIYDVLVGDGRLFRDITIDWDGKGGLAEDIADAVERFLNE